ncbi:chemotaxis protein CheC [Sporolactobacillus inulinus]|nr:chemotaxis protein CheC [Sporolactobacillus inulinus]GEB78535.1 hypothetical protein SIN01_28800 [Sporolactobacillus inulinus]
MANKLNSSDIMTELFNIGVGQAANTLSDIIGKRIDLSIPNVSILNLEKGKHVLDHYLAQVAEGTVMVSSISFDQQLEGRVSLLFPADKMHQFIALCLHETWDEEAVTKEFTDIDYDTIREIGNIVINSMIGELSNAVSIPVKYTLPEIDVLDHACADHFVVFGDNQLVLIMYLDFDIEGTEIAGAIVINMSLNSLEEILDQINKLYNGV